MKSLERVSKFLKQHQRTKFNSPEEDYEFDRRNEPGFDPGPSRGVKLPREMKEDIAEVIESFLKENPTADPEDVYNEVNRVLDLDEYGSDGWRFVWDIVTDFGRTSGIKMKSLERVSKFLQTSIGNYENADNFEQMLGVLEDLHYSLRAKKKEYAQKDEWFELESLTDEAIQQVNKLHTALEYLQDAAGNFDVTESLDDNYTNKY